MVWNKHPSWKKSKQKNNINLDNINKMYNGFTGYNGNCSLLVLMETVIVPVGLYSVAFYWWLVKTT